MTDFQENLSRPGIIDARARRLLNTGLERTVLEEEELLEDLKEDGHIREE